jgi:ubiquinol-cytochrome c reductase cytochrome b subunit
MRRLRFLWRWLDDRIGIAQRIAPLAGHPVPPGARWMYVFGSATLAVFILQVATGVVLATTYIPSTGSAYHSLQFITHDAPLGNFVRGLHYWGASAMMVLIGLHLIRVFLTGSYKYPREVNWLSGVLLLGLTLGMSFTGQLLRWDQNAYWSVVVGAEQAGRAPYIGLWIAHFIMGGDTVGASTLSRFFALHVFGIPPLIVAVVGLHLYLVLRHGISEPAVAGRPVDPSRYKSDYENMLRAEGVPFWPNAVWRDAIFAVAVVLALASLAALVGPANLDKPPNPTLIDAHPRPDWYFWWYFALLAYLPPALENYVIILGPLALGVLLIMAPLVGYRGERHPLRRPWAVAEVLLALGMVGALTVAGWKENWSPRFDAAPLTADLIGASTGPVYSGGEIFNRRGCLYCHRIDNHGGKRGPDLSRVADRMTRDQMTLRILNGAVNMPAFAGILSFTEMNDLVSFLATRRAPGNVIGNTETKQAPHPGQ